jgi:hypothetical protein
VHGRAAQQNSGTLERVQRNILISPTKGIPWLRVAVEGVVIVGSILLAFGIDAWWEALGRRDEARSAVVALTSDFEAVERQLDNFRAGNERTIIAIDSVADLLRGRTEPVEVPARLLAWVVRTPTPSPPTGALDALLNSGSLALLEDPELGRALAAWPAKFSHLNSRAELALAFVTDQVLPVLSRNSDIEPVVAYRAWQQSQRGSGVAPPEVDVMLGATDEVRDLLHARRYLTVELIGASWSQTKNITTEVLDGLARHGS